MQGDGPASPTRSAASTSRPKTPPPKRALHFNVDNAFKRADESAQDPPASLQKIHDNLFISKQETGGESLPPDGWQAFGELELDASEARTMADIRAWLQRSIGPVEFELLQHGRAVHERSAIDDSRPVQVRALDRKTVVVRESHAGTIDSQSFDGVSRPRVPTRVVRSEDDELHDPVGARRGQALSVEQRRMIMRMLDQQQRDPSLSYRKIQALTGIHRNTVYKLKKQRDAQNCTRVTVDDNFQRTVTVPLPGRQGGFRGCKLNDEQKRACTRIVVENPRLTVAQVRTELEHQFPTLSVSEATVWRTLHNSNLSFLRAKLRDPRREGTAAHRAEKEAFLAEQAKGNAGLLGASNLFFMDETIVYLNETPGQAWGSATKLGEIRKSKGKTSTIGLYAGLGLVDASYTSEEWNSKREQLYAQRPAFVTDGRSNAYVVDKDGSWQVASDAPRFALYWWLRPATRKTTVLPKFLQIEDVLDPNFELALFLVAPGGDVRDFETPLPWSQPTAGDDVVHVRKDHDKFTLQDNANVNLSTVFEDEEKMTLPNRFEASVLQGGGGGGATLAIDAAFLQAFLACDFSVLDHESLAEMLWYNNIEHRQVDADGNLVKVPYKKSLKGLKASVLVSKEKMLEYLTSLKRLVVRAVRSIATNREDIMTIIDRHPVGAVADEPGIPRAFFTRFGRQRLGGRLESERGDQNLFLSYIRGATDYFDRSFPASIRQAVRMAWDSAPQHGKVDVTRNVKSFVHEWVVRVLNIVGAIFLPVRDPDTNPAERLFAFIKHVVRRKMTNPLGEVSEREMMQLIDEAFMEVTPKMVEGWVRHAAYKIDGDEQPDTDKAIHPDKLFDALIRAWSHRTRQHLSAATRQRLAANDQRVARDVMVRYHTVGDAFAGSNVRAVQIGPSESARTWEAGLTGDAAMGAFMQMDGGRWFKEWATTNLQRIDPKCMLWEEVADDGNALSLKTDKERAYFADADAERWVASDGGAVTFLILPKKHETKETVRTRERAYRCMDLQALAAFRTEMSAGIVVYRDPSSSADPLGTLFEFDGNLFRNAVRRAGVRTVHRHKREGYFGRHTEGVTVVAKDDGHVTLQGQPFDGFEKNVTYTVWLVDPVEGGSVVFSSTLSDAALVRVANPAAQRASDVTNSQIPLDTSSQIPLNATVTRLYQTGCDTSDNVSTEEYRALLSILRLHEDETHFSLLAEWARAFVPKSKLGELDELAAEMDGRRGVLHALGRAVAHSVRACAMLEHLESTLLPVAEEPARASRATRMRCMDALLDMHEHMFSTTTVAEFTVSAADGRTLTLLRTSKDRRHVPTVLVVRHSSDEARVRNLDESLVSVIAENSLRAIIVPAAEADRANPIAFGNERVGAYALRTHANEFAQTADLVRTELAHTPYASSIPGASERSRDFSTCAIALAAFEHEHERAHAARKRFVERVLETGVLARPDSGVAQDAFRTTVDDQLREWRRFSAPGEPGSKHGQRVVGDATAPTMAYTKLAPRLSIHALRKERRARVRMERFARGDANERRWPGYPFEEQHVRAGKPIVQTGGTKAQLEFIKAIRHIDLRAVYKGSEAVEAIVIFEDDTRVELKPIRLFPLQQTNSAEQAKAFAKLPEVSQRKPSVTTHGDAPQDDFAVSASGDTVHHNGAIRLNVNLREMENAMGAVFGTRNEENQLKLKIARQRLDEKLSKSTKTARPDAILGICGDYAIERIAPNVTKPMPSDETSVTLLYDAAKNGFRPPDNESYDELLAKMNISNPMKAYIVLQDGNFATANGRKTIVFDASLKQLFKPRGLTDCFPNLKFYSHDDEHYKMYAKCQTGGYDDDKLTELDGTAVEFVRRSEARGADVYRINAQGQNTLIADVVALNETKTRAEVLVPKQLLKHMCKSQPVNALRHIKTFSELQDAVSSRNPGYQNAANPPPDEIS